MKSKSRVEEGKVSPSAAKGATVSPNSVKIKKVSPNKEKGAKDSPNSAKGAKDPPNAAKAAKISRNERKTLAKERKKLAYNRLTRTYMRTLINPAKKRKPSDSSFASNGTQYCTCVAGPRKSSSKGKKKKKAGPRGRDMNCFHMTKNHWKTPPYWDGRSDDFFFQLKENSLARTKKYIYTL